MRCGLNINRQFIRTCAPSRCNWFVDSADRPDGVWCASEHIRSAIEISEIPSLPYSIITIHRACHTIIAKTCKTSISAFYLWHNLRVTSFVKQNVPFLRVLFTLLSIFFHRYRQIILPSFGNTRYRFVEWSAVQIMQSWLTFFYTPVKNSTVAIEALQFTQR